MDIYYFPGATCAVKVRLIAAEKVADVVEIEVGPDERDRAAYRSIHPQGLVPALVDGPFVLTESTTIMRYLDEAQDGPPLQPLDPQNRARANNWLKRFDEEVFPAIGYLSLGLSFRRRYLAQPREEWQARLRATSPNSAVAAMRIDAVENGGQAEAVGLAFAAVRRLLADMQACLTGQSLLSGEAYGLADAAYTAGFVRFDELGFDGLWRDLPAVAGWWAAIRERPSFEAVVMTSPNPSADALREAGLAALPGLLKAH